MHDMRRFVPPALAVAMTAVFVGGSLRAQRSPLAFLPVGDLLAPRDADEPYVSPPEYPGARWILGEEAWIPDWFDRSGPRKGVPWFGSSELVDLVADLAGRPAGDLAVLPGNDTIAVPSGVEPAVRAVLEELRQRLPPVVRFELDLRCRRDGKEQILLQRSIACVSGRARVTSAVEEMQGIADYEVEIAQSASIANPWVRTMRTGAMVVLRPWVTPSADVLLVEALTRVAEPIATPPIDLGHPGFGPIERRQMHVAETAGLMRGRIGGPDLGLVWRGPDGVEYSLRLKPQWNPLSPVRPGGHELEYAVDFVRSAGFRSIGRVPEDAGSEEGGGGLAAVVGAVGITVRQAVEGSNACVALDAAAEALRLLATARAQAAASGPTVELSLYDVPSGGSPETDGARRLGGATVSLVEGSWVCATSFEENTIVTEWDVEVAQASRIPDPKPSRAQNGLFVNLRWLRSVLEVDGELALRQPDIVRDVPLDMESAAPDNADERKTGDRTYLNRQNATFLPQDRVRMEQPVIRRVPFTASLTPRGNAPVTARQAAAVFGAGRELLIVARQQE